MSDPPRLLSPESGATEIQRLMLRAWAEERPTPTAREGALAALGLGPPGATALAMTKLAKWTLLLLGIGAPAVVAVYRGQTNPPAPLVRIETATREQTAPTLEPTRAQPPAVDTAEHPAARAQAHARPARDTLPAEIAALDQARAALRDGDPTEACALVDGYDRSFPRGALREEAIVVRIEALIAAGHADEARRRTEAFTASHPTSPHASRLRRLLLEP